MGGRHDFGQAHAAECADESDKTGAATTDGLLSSIDLRLRYPACVSGYSLGPNGVQVIKQSTALYGLTSAHPRPGVESNQMGVSPVNDPAATQRLVGG